MPYNSSDLPGSWLLLKRHIHRGADPWVQEATAACECSHKIIGAILCICRSQTASDIDPQFKCELKEKDILILLKNNYPARVDVAVQLFVPSDCKLEWIKPHGRVASEPAFFQLMPALSKLFRTDSKFKDLVARIKPDNSLTSLDGITVLARIVPDNGVTPLAIKNVETSRTIHELQPRLEAEVAF